MLFRYADTLRHDYAFTLPLPRLFCLLMPRPDGAFIDDAAAPPLPPAADYRDVPPLRCRQR